MLSPDALRVNKCFFIYEFHFSQIYSIFIRIYELHVCLIIVFSGCLPVIFLSRRPSGHCTDGEYRQIRPKIRLVSSIFMFFPMRYTWYNCL
jgi:hypothetical protein